MMRLRLSLAAWFDRWDARRNRLLEKWGWPQAWLQEFQDYLNEPRMTPEEFWVRYTLKRMDAQPRITGQLTEAQALAFYRESDYMLWRNLVHRRHSAWRRVLMTMRGRHGTLVEYGCGIAPISAWMKRRKPAWRYILRDVEESPHFRYARWRIKPAEDSFPNCEVLTLVDVLEHLDDPLKAVKTVIPWMNSGGYLHWNFVGNPRRNDLDLATPEQRDATVRYLYDTLELVWEGEGYRVSRKRTDERRDPS